jgi:DNA-directed RNA polymerase subunit K/omega
MVKRPDGMNAFEFSVLSGLRAAQLHRGCTPRVAESHKPTVTAQHEIAERKVVRFVAETPALATPADPAVR